MTSNPDWRHRLPRIVAAVSGLGLLAAGWAWEPARADAAGARVALARSLTLLRDGNATAARTAAQDAVREDANWGLAHAVLARAHLGTGEAELAEAELDRAIATGFDPRRTPQLRAHAALLRRDLDAALRQSAQAAPRYAGYALRVRGQALAARGDLTEANAALDEAVRAAPRNPEVWTALGRVRYAAGNLAEAGEAAARAVALGPNSVEALQLRGELVREQYGLVAALPWFEGALKRDAWAHDVLIEYAATLGDIGRTREMLDATRRAMEARPGSPQGYYLQAVLAARAEQWELARDLLTRGGDDLVAVPGAVLLGGVLDLQSGANEQAVLRLRDLVGLQPMNIPARKLLATALLRSGTAREALEVLRPVAIREDADSGTLSLVARAFERLGDRGWAARYLDRASVPVRAAAGAFGTDDALAGLAAAANAAPGDPNAAIPYIRALIDAKRGADAVTAARQVAADNAGVPAAQLVLGDALAAAGNFAEAAVAYRRAAALRFDEPTLLRLVDALDRSGRREQAARALALYLSQNPASVAGQRLAAHWQIAAGEFDAAIDTLEDLRFRLGNRDAALLAELAYGYSGADEHDRAASYGAAAYRLLPANPAVADAYGWALYRAGDTGAAAALIGKAVGIAPGHAGLRWHLAQVQADLGQRQAAIASARAALRDPSFNERRAAEELIALLA